jgi:RecA-family ATPase
MTTEVAGTFWFDEISASKGHKTSIISQECERKISAVIENANKFTVPDCISDKEWNEARASPTCIVDRWFYQDVGVIIAPGGTGKTTLVLFQAIHVALGRPLFGHEVLTRGPVVLLTAEDSREQLVARLREISRSMDLSDSEVRVIQRDVRISDVSGLGFKLTKVERDSVVPSTKLDRFISAVSSLSPAIVFVDPAVSFGVGESRVNDAEQGLIEAARRIRNEVGCAVVYIHHTGKQSARLGTTDQYAGRGGSAFADGSRMVHVLHLLKAAEWTNATGDALKDGEVGLVLSRPKMSHTPPQPDIFVKRSGYQFELAEKRGPGNSVADENADHLWELIRQENAASREPTGRSLESSKTTGMRQKPLREALAHLLATGRVEYLPSKSSGQGGARRFLHAVVPDQPS